MTTLIPWGQVMALLKTILQTSTDHSTRTQKHWLKTTYPNVLTLRVRMPLSDDLHPRNFISKITKYERVVNIPNSMTVLHDLLPISVNMFERRLVGIYNFTNPGAISHNEILDLYAKHIDPTFTYKTDQSRILQAGRSNNELDCGKLLQAVPDCMIPHIKDSVVQLFHRMKTNLSVTQPQDDCAPTTVHHCNHLDGGSVTSSRAV